jgi:hypothetical protein
VRRAIVLGAVGAMALLASASRADEPSSAEQPSQRTLAAEELFKLGRSLITKHRYKEACEKLNASEKIDPAVGTLVSLGECYSGLGRSASAWLAYRSAIALATQRHDPRKAGVEERAAAVEPQISNLVLRLSGDATSSTQIAIDGEPLGRDIVGAPIPIDPGPHSIVVAAPGYKKWSGRIQVETLGDTIPVEVPPLEPLPDPAVVESARKAAATRRTVGLVAGGVGLVGLGVGLILGSQAIVKIHEANDACPSGPTCSNASAVNENQSGKSFGIASSVVVPVSLAVLGAGTFLFFASHGPRQTEVAADVSPGGGRLRVGWSW